ncbi:chorismate-binding protein [Antarcticibacterium arcticum]|uniref:chorismate-binding protein n=1 Tax=Antarcticibacterium arcticum TaxID=2585771 RepID=UPI0021D00D69|nr:chorismate-binding protein [Antarcticibacterium arcticum]
MQHTSQFFKLLHSQWIKELPFAAYRDLGQSEKKLKALLQKDAAINKVSDFSESGFVFAPFDSTREVILIPVNNSEEIYSIFNGDEHTSGAQFKPDTTTEIAEENEAHQGLVQLGIDAIKAGELEKVVLSRKEILQVEDRDPIEIFKRLLKRYPDAFVYIWYHPEIGLWLGATPETLLQVERNRFKTMALAGTKNYSGEIEVEWGGKKRKNSKL